jgi:hypothetical protein
MVVRVVSQRPDNGDEWFSSSNRLALIAQNSASASAVEEIFNVILYISLTPYAPMLIFSVFRAIVADSFLTLSGSS